MAEEKTGIFSGMGKTIFTGVAGALVGAGIVAVLGVQGFFQKPFVPSKETCNTYYETMNGSYLCVIYGSKEGENKSTDDIIKDFPKAEPSPAVVPAPVKK